MTAFFLSLKFEGASICSASASLDTSTSDFSIHSPISIIVIGSPTGKLIKLLCLIIRETLVTFSSYFISTVLQFPTLKAKKYQ